MIVRRERPADIAAIRRVHEAAFPSPTEADIVDALRSAGRLTISLVAEERGTVIGHIAFSPMRFEGAPDLAGALGLAPVAVHPQFQGKGTGASLIREGLAACREVGCTCVVVLGEPAYYRRFGFLPAWRWGLDNEYEAGDAFMAMELQSGAIPENPGLARYAPEFNVFQSDQD